MWFPERFWGAACAMPQDAASTFGGKLCDICVEICLNARFEFSEITEVF